MVKNYTIFGERCSGTGYLEALMEKNFDTTITWAYGWKHYFGFEDFNNSDDTLFICIVRNLPDWINSFYRTKWDLHLRYDKPHSKAESLQKFLHEELWSVDINELKEGRIVEHMHDRNMFTKERYKNIFELRETKLKWMHEVLPTLVKNCLVIRYEDLRTNLTRTLIKIQQKGRLRLRSNINFPVNVTNLIRGNVKKAAEFKETKNEIPDRFIMKRENFGEYDQKLYPKIFNALP